MQTLKNSYKIISLDKWLQKFMPILNETSLTPNSIPLKALEHNQNAKKTISSANYVIQCLRSLSFKVKKTDEPIKDQKVASTNY